MTEQEGYGRFEYKDGSIYEGNWCMLNGKRVRQGFGKLTQPFREYYEGDWINDLMDGQGIYQYTSGAIYKGQWVKGKAHGKGIYEFQDGSIYDGQWQNHLMHGEGVFISLEGKKFQGEFVNGEYQLNIQDQLKQEKIIQQKKIEVAQNAQMFFNQFEAKFLASDKKTFKDNLSPFFPQGEEVSQFYSGVVPKFDEKQPAQWKECISKLSNCEIIVLQSPQQSTFIPPENILAPQLQSQGQIVECQSIVIFISLGSKRWIVSFRRSMGVSIFPRDLRQLIQIQFISLMISNNIKKALQAKNKQFFAVVKKTKMELTLRTPYKTYFEKFDGFQRIIAKSNEAALIVQNKSPASLYVLPPGQLQILRNLKVKLTQEVKGTTGDLLHLGGWMIVHADNTCEVNLMDAFEKSEVKPDLFDKSDIPKERDDPAGKYTTKLRKQTAKVFTKKAI